VENNIFQKVKNRLHNHTEDIVLEMIKELLNNDKYDEICKCEQCLIEMVTYSLNRIPAKYISSHAGSVYTKLEELEQQYQVNVVKIITKAINTVMNNPSKNCYSRKDNRDLQK